MSVSSRCSTEWPQCCRIRRRCFGSSFRGRRERSVWVIKQVRTAFIAGRGTLRRDSVMEWMGNKPGAGCACSTVHAASGKVRFPTCYLVFRQRLVNDN